jgi:hypothetical protein
MNNNGNNDQAKKEALSKIESINAVEGFDPAPLALEFGNMNDGSKRQRLPVMAQMAWFRLKYPEGRIAVTVKAGKDYFIGEARVYANYKDPADYYLAEGSASRGYLKDNPTVSPREWAQTAAIGIALRNAGFGLQFAIAGDSFEDNTLNELPFMNVQEAPDNIPGATAPVNNTGAESTEQNISQTENQPEVQSIESPQVQAQPESTPLEKAMAVMCPIGKYKDKTLGEMVSIDPKALAYVAKSGDKYGNDISGYATLICENALNQVAV